MPAHEAEGLPLVIGLFCCYIGALNASSGAFVFDTRFNLEHDSVLTGVLIVISSGTLTLARSIVFDGQPFDLGTQPGTAGVISISFIMDRISLSGTHH